MGNAINSDVPPTHWKKKDVRNLNKVFKILKICVLRDFVFLFDIYIYIYISVCILRSVTFSWSILGRRLSEQETCLDRHYTKVMPQKCNEI